MSASSESLSLMSIFALVTFFVMLLTKKFSSKIGQGILLDKDFDKPQAFHKEAIPRCGGIAAIICLIIFFTFYFLIFNEFSTKYFTLSFAIFLLGFSDDIKLKINPYYRLILMIIILMFFIFFTSTNIRALDLNFVNLWMENKIFMTLFILLCFLFIINGANLIDGFNGLLTIHLLIINLVLLSINLNNNHEELTMILTSQIVILLTFLLFNFPKATMFLGDSGSYLFGALVAYNIIETNNLNPQVSSFFFCVLLFYLFFEVFFSFFRKLYLGKSPLKPDKNHLHMLMFKFLEKSRKYEDCNYLNSVIINLIYFCLIIPIIFFQENGLVCRYWFFSLLILYMVFYYILYSFEKKQ